MSPTRYESFENQEAPSWLDEDCPRQGRYALGPLLGAGGMGEVREAWDMLLRRTVALKILRLADPEAVARLLREAQINARLAHPNICQIHDVEYFEGALRVAMRLVRGPNLQQLRPELGRREAVAILCRVAQAAAELHRHQLVHRDIKPSNILLERGADGAWVPYLSDFGLALDLADPQPSAAGGVQGTPVYMAPEQLRTVPGQIGPAADVFALGGTLHFALTGQPPPGPSRSRDADLDALPRELRLILGRCLEPDPALRYPTAAGLAADLQRHLEGRPVLARSPGFLRRLGRGAAAGLFRARRWLLPAAVAAALALAFQALQEQRIQEVRRQAQMTHRVVLQAADMEMQVHLESMLAVHDFRPTYERLRKELERERGRLALAAPPWRPRGHYAVGCYAFLLHDYGLAWQELEQAWRGGYREAPVARLLLYAGTALADQDGRPGADLDALDALVAQSKGLAREVDEPIEVLAAFQHGDYEGAADWAHATVQVEPWNGPALTLESTCRTLMARGHLEAGDLPKAAAHLREAVAVADNGLLEHPSDPALRHARLRAALALAALRLEAGEASDPDMAELQAGCADALRIDPGDRRLQADQLGLLFLKALTRADLGQDPQEILEDALAYRAAWVREPLAPPLRADWMLIHWLLAERQLLRGGDPEPPLAVALRYAEHTPLLPRDYYWEVQGLPARIALARGRDPRPSVRTQLDAIGAVMDHSGAWYLRESAAEAWLVQSLWEARHGLDAAASARSAHALAEGARGRIPASPSGRALEGLATLQALPADPARQAERLLQARNDLRDSLQLGFGGRPQAQLKRSLQALGER